MIINHNMNALNAHRNMGMNVNAAGKSMEKLSSGLRINRAGDDAAGLAISEKMRGQIKGLDQAQRNAQDGISLIQTAEGALNETHNILQRMRELAVQGANDTNTTDDRSQIDKEMKQLMEEIDRISEQTQFNEKNLLDGSFDGKFQIGANSEQSVGLEIGKLNSESLGLKEATEVDGTTPEVVTRAAADQNLALTSDGTLAKDQTITLTNGDKTFDVKLSAGTTLASAGDAIKEQIMDKVTGLDSEATVVAINDETGEITITAKTAGEERTTITTATTDATLDADLAAEKTIEFDFDGNKVQITLATGTTLASAGEAIGQALEAKGYTATAAVDSTSGAITLTNVSKNPVEGTAVNITSAVKDTPVASVDKENASVAGTISSTGLDLSGDKAATITIAGKEITLNGNYADADTFATALGSAIKEQLPNATINVNGTAVEGTTRAIAENEIVINIQTGANGSFSISSNVDMEIKGLTEAGVEDGVVETPLQKVDVSTHEKATKSIKTINEAIKQVSDQRSNLGAMQNRLEHTIANLGTSSENLTAAESRVRDVDMAKEMLNFSKNNILQQAAQSMLAQAKSQPEGVLQLLR